MTEHTPGKVVAIYGAVLLDSPFPRQMLAQCQFDGSEVLPEEIANAEHLALCWNSHEDLLAALELLEDWAAEYQDGYGACLFCGPHHADNCPMSQARAAIAKVKGAAT